LIVMNNKGADYLYTKVCYLLGDSTSSSVLAYFSNRIAFLSQPRRNFKLPSLKIPSRKQ
jgi:hypothetical protein